MVTGGMTIIEQNTMEAIQSINQKMPDIELRDLFAIHAMNALLPTGWGMEASEDNIAKYSYKMADAMLEARKKK